VAFTEGVIVENDSQHYYNMGGPLYMLPDVNYSSYSSSLSGSYIYLPISLGITYPDTADSDTEDVDTEEVSTDTEDADTEEASTDTEDTDSDEDTEEATVTYTSIIDTTDDSVCKNHPETMTDYGFEEGDEMGPFSVGLAVEDVVDDENTTQLLVFASPYIFTDEASQLTANNATLFADAISNMIPETESAGSVIPEKSYTLGNITVSALYAVLLGILVTIAAPLILLIIGIVIFVVRRKK
jgi:ABC-2 type transport system permease protein